MLHQPDQPFVVNTSPFLILQPIYEVKRHAHYQFLTFLKHVSIIFEQFWMPCLNGGIALFIFIHHTLNNKWPFMWFWANILNISYCHQLNVILFKLLRCCRFFLVEPHHLLHSFWNNFWSNCLNSSEVALCPLLPWYCVKLSWNIWFRDYQHVFYLEKVNFHLGKDYFKLISPSI